MADFKFACPVCGQHITADSKSSGSTLECPTCFQKIVVPQAPAAGDSKFILSAAQAGKPRPLGTDLGADLQPLKHEHRGSWLGAALLGALVLGAGAAAYHWRGPLLKRFSGGGGHPPPGTAVTHVATSPYPVPTNVSWTLQPGNAPLPLTRAAGRVRGLGFQCERATLQGGTLTLRQGKNWPPDLGFSVQLFAQQAEDLSGKTVLVTPERPPPVPKVLLRWKDGRDKGVSHTFTGGYALKVVFGQPANGRMPGQIYIALPDAEQSFAAGSFDAEIRKPQPPRPKP